MSGIDDFLAGNERFAASFTSEDLPILPAKGAIVVSCVDARVDPALAFDLELGDVLVLRTLGGRVTPDVRAQVGMLGALMSSVPGGGHPDVVVMHHTQCGTVRFADPELRATAARAGGVAGHEVDAVVVDDPFRTIAADVAVIAAAVPAGVRVQGFVYDIATGRVDPV